MFAFPTSTSTVVTVRFIWEDGTDAHTIERGATRGFHHAAWANSEDDIVTLDFSAMYDELEPPESVRLTSAHILNEVAVYGWGDDDGRVTGFVVPHSAVE